MESMESVIKWMSDHPTITIFAAFTLIEFVPIKINPWGFIFKCLRKGLGITQIESGFIKLKRWFVLDFGNSCQNGRKHTKEEWVHCIEELAEYEEYCKQNKITNGVMDEMAIYLRKEYREKMETGDFLK